jgi:predicted Zn-dependent peptidase
MSVQFKQQTLDNGLQIVAEVNDAAHTAAAGVFVRTGSRDEPAERMGVSHFLEHLVFKGTERRTAEQVNLDFDRIGAEHNAMTGQESPIFYAHVLPEYLPDALDVLTDVMRPTLRAEDFEVEKQVILEEIGMYADQPQWQVMEQAFEDFYGSHPLGYRILGTQDTIEALDRDQMMEYFRRRYGPDNMVISLAGRVDFDQCVKQIADACGSWEPSGTRREHGTVEPRGTQRTLTREAARRCYIIGICPGASTQDEQRYPAAVLGQVLGDPDGSRLYWKLVDPGLAEEAELSHQGFDRTGCYMLFACCDPENADEVENALTEVIDHAGDDLTEEELQRARSKMRMDLTLQNERPAGRMMALGSQWLYLGEHVPLEEELRRIEAVDVDAVQALLKDYPMQPRTMTRLLPDGQ